MALDRPLSLLHRSQLPAYQWQARPCVSSHSVEVNHVAITPETLADDSFWCAASGTQESRHREGLKVVLMYPACAMCAGRKAPGGLVAAWITLNVSVAWEGMLISVRIGTLNLHRATQPLSHATGLREQCQPSRLSAGVISSTTKIARLRGLSSTASIWTITHSIRCKMLARR